MNTFRDRRIELTCLLCHVSRSIIIAGPNGAGKTTFARAYRLPAENASLRFLNVDLIASGLAPDNPESVSLEAGKIHLAQLREVVRAGHDFMLESTLSGRGHAQSMREWKAAGYIITIYYLKLSTPDAAVARVRNRVAEGGHSVPEADIRRRFTRSWENFVNLYRPLADRWTILDSNDNFQVIEESL